MSRIDVCNVSSIEVNEKYYIIEFQSNGKWYQLTDQFYLPEYEYGQNSACGACWQKTGQYGMYDEEYAKEYCNKLNEALQNGTLKVRYEVAECRVARVKWTFKKEVLAPKKY